MKINGKRIIGLEKQIFKVFAISQENAFVEKNMLLELYISIFFLGKTLSGQIYILKCLEILWKHLRNIHVSKILGFQFPY